MRASVFLRALLVMGSAVAAGLSTAGDWAFISVPLALGCLIWNMGSRLLRNTAWLFCWLLVYFLFALGWMIWALQSPGEWTFAWSIPLMLIVFSLFAASYAVSYWGLGLLVKWLRPNFQPLDGKLTHCFLLAAAFLFGDVMRVCLGLGSTWGSLGYSQTANPWMSGMYALVGTPGVSALTVFWVGLLVAGLQSLLSRTRTRGEGALAHTPPSFRLLALAAGLIGLCLLARTWHWTHALDRPQPVRLVHTSLFEGQKYTPEAQAAAQGLLLDLAQRTDAVATLYPELFLVHPAFEYPKDWRAEVMAAVKRSGNHQIVGAPDSLVSAQRVIQGATNAMIHLGPEGSVRRRPKESLIPFTEQTSANAVIVWVYSLFSAYPNANFLPAGMGDTAPFEMPGFKLAAAICSEISDPMIVNARLLTAGTLLNASSESWIHSATLDGLIVQMLQARALESQKPILRAGNGGFSGVVTERGHVLRTEALHTVVSVQTRTGETPYARAMAWFYGAITPPASDPLPR